MWCFGMCLRDGLGSVSLVAALDLRGLFQSMILLFLNAYYQHFVYFLPDSLIFHIFCALNILLGSAVTQGECCDMRHRWIHVWGQ